MWTVTKRLRSLERRILETDHSIYRKVQGRVGWQEANGFAANLTRLTNESKHLRQALTQLLRTPDWPLRFHVEAQERTQVAEAQRRAAVRAVADR